MSYTQIALLPGVYRNGSRCPRTLVKVVGRVCIYSFDDPEQVLKDQHQPDVADKIHVTTCSVRTFSTAIGITPAREFTTEERDFLASHMISMRPRRQCSRVQRNLLFPMKARDAKVVEQAIDSCISSVLFDREDKRLWWMATAIVQMKNAVGQRWAGFLAWIKRLFTIRTPARATA